MPSYEYLCERCNSEYEVSRPMAESALPWKCPSCKTDCKRVIGKGANFILKGPGWPGKEIKNKG